MKLEINYKKKIHNYVKIKQHATKTTNVLNKKSSEKSKNILRQMKKELQHSETYCVQQKQL